MHNGKELEAHQVQKGRWSCDSYAPQIGSAQSHSTRVVKVNGPKKNRRKTRPYCTHIPHTKPVYGLNSTDGIKSIPPNKSLILVYSNTSCQS